MALLGGLVLAAVGALAVDLPALALGVTDDSSEHTPPGLTIADTFVQDLAFVGAAVYCAHIGGRAVHAWQLGLRRPGSRWRSAARLVAGAAVRLHRPERHLAGTRPPDEEKLLETLGTQEGAALLVLSAGADLRRRPDLRGDPLPRVTSSRRCGTGRGTMTAAVITGLLFGGVHAFSAPALDLLPLAALGFGLCLLYRYTGSLYPCMVAHSLNNSVAFVEPGGVGLAGARSDGGVDRLDLAADPRGREGGPGAAGRPCSPARTHRIVRMRNGHRLAAACPLAVCLALPAACPRRGTPDGPVPLPSPHRRQEPSSSCIQKAGGKPLFAFVGRGVVVRGIVTPYVAGQAVKVELLPRWAQDRCEDGRRAPPRQRDGPVPPQPHERLRGVRAGAGGALCDAPAGRLQRPLARASGSSTRAWPRLASGRRCGCCSPS